MSGYVIVDIDGVVADCTHRLPFIKTDPPDWDGFFNAATDDAPLWPMIRFLRAISPYTRLCFETGRPERISKLTTRWLDGLGLLSGAGFYMCMRADGDHRPDHEVKKELYLTKILPFYNRQPPAAVFEDRDQVVEMWRGLGLLCLQPKKGDY